MRSHISAMTSYYFIIFSLWSPIIAR